MHRLINEIDLPSVTDVVMREIDGAGVLGRMAMGARKPIALWCKFLIHTPCKVRDAGLHGRFGNQNQLAHLMQITGNENAKLSKNRKFKPRHYLVSRAGLAGGGARAKTHTGRC